jgi:hypothetical protein
MAEKKIYESNVTALYFHRLFGEYNIKLDYSKKN